MSIRVVTLGVALAMLAACSSKTPDTPASHASPAASVTMVTATQDAWPATFESGGIVHARVSTPIASRLMATVTAVHVRIGDRVRAGAPLVTLDAREPVANQARAAAGIAAARQAADAAAADEAAADANLTLARLTHARIADLAAKQSATPQELDQAVAALASADAQLRSAKARRAAAEASREAATAAVSAADAHVSDTHLTAPFDAVVTERQVEPGTMATPGAPLLVLEEPTHQRLEVRVDEARAAWVRAGQTVEISLDTPGPDAARMWTPAMVAELARLDAASHTFTVKIDLPDAVAARSGAVGRVRFTGPTRAALAVPDTAVLRRGQLTFVFVVDSAHLAHLRALSTGDVARGRVEVLAGLAAGDLVVNNPPPTLLDGQPVQPATAQSGGRP